MKKQLFLLPLLLATLTAGAQNLQLTGKRTYYGEKARDSMVNPCKGRLVTVCGVIETLTDPNERNWDGAGSTALPSKVGGGLGLNVWSTVPAVWTLWRVPANTSEQDFLKIKQMELKYPNLKVVKGLDDESDSLDEE